MNSYRVLNNHVFSQGKYSLVPIRMEDRYEIMRWRNEQIYHLRQSEPLTKEMQDTYFENVVSQLLHQEKPSQILFSYLEDDVCIGYGGLVHINWVDRNAEISFIMDTALEEEFFHKHWSIYLDLLEQVAFNDLNLHKIYTYAFDLRPHLYTMLEKNGFVREATLSEHCLFEGKYRDVVIHSRINRGISYRRIEASDINIVFEWNSNPKVRKQSFNSEPIPFDHHVKWFSEKLNDKNATYYIAELNQLPISLIRFDEKEEEIVVGILIEETMQGRGFAKEFLSKLSRREFYHRTTNKPIVAYIKESNIASIKSVLKSSYRFENNLVINGNNFQKYIFHE